MITRFAPSPTGPLHLGHAYSAILAHEQAIVADGTFLLRIEDTDSTRVRPEYEQAIYDDLAWLGMSWEQPVRRQSDHYADYDKALNNLAKRGLIYPCSCTRRIIQDAGAETGHDGFVYPGICRHRSMADAQPGDALRLNIAAGLTQIKTKPSFIENAGSDQTTHFVSAEDLETRTGDIVLRRKDTGDPAYHLACVHDDGLQGITHIIRGQDLWPLTPVQVLLQRLLDLPTPTYHHHRLITDDRGRRLAKVDRSKALAKYRAEGATPNDIRQMVGLPQT